MHYKIPPRAADGSIRQCAPRVAGHSTPSCRSTVAAADSQRLGDRIRPARRRHGSARSAPHRLQAVKEPPSPVTAGVCAGRSRRVALSVSSTQSQGRPQHPARAREMAVGIGFPRCDSIRRISGLGVRASAVAGQCLSGMPGWFQDCSGTMRRGWIQLDLMGHDPESASRWPGTFRDYGRHTDGTRYSRGGYWRNSRSVAILVGWDGLTVAMKERASAPGGCWKLDASVFTRLGGPYVGSL